MSTGGVFQIITNDGKQDRMLMATALLHDRLDKIWRAKKAVNPGLADDDVRVLPSLLDIEKTHILFTNAHFKPFAAIGFEYNKVRPTAGNTSLGSNIQFSIPQFGDFFHDIAFHCVLSQPTMTATAGTADQNKPAMRWCNFPGERLLKKVQQEVNGNPLDEYTVHATVAHREYRVAPNKLTAWKRCTGQEEPEMGNVRQADWAGSNKSPDSHRVLSQVSVGAQTPSAQKSGSLDLFVPLLFWLLLKLHLQNCTCNSSSGLLNICLLVLRFAIISLHLTPDISVKTWMSGIVIPYMKSKHTEQPVRMLYLRQV